MTAPYPLDYLKNDKFNPNLKINDKIRIINSADPSLNGLEGVLEGIVSLHLMICWLVRLDEEWYCGFGFNVKCVSIPSMCLEKIEG